MPKEYIERERLLQDIEHYHLSDGKFQHWVEIQPAADVAEVRHGRWIASHGEFCACSICKYPVYVGWNQTNYCPNCGAYMMGENNGKCE